MDRKSYLGLSTVGVGFALWFIGGQFSPCLAQIRGGSSERFFNGGNIQMQQEIQNMQNPAPQPNLNTEETQLDQQLNVQESNPDQPKGSEVNAPAPDYINNTPESPEDEVQFKF